MAENYNQKSIQNNEVKQYNSEKIINEHILLSNKNILQRRRMKNGNKNSVYNLNKGLKNLASYVAYLN